MKIDGTENLNLSFSVENGLPSGRVSPAKLVDALRSAADKIEAAAKMGFMLKHGVMVSIELQRAVQVDLTEKTSSAVT